MAVDTKISQLPPVAAPLTMTDLFPVVAGGVTSRATGQQVNTLLNAWAVKTGAYTASAFDRILADTSGGAFAVTLPASPAPGDQVEIADGASFAVNALTIGRNGATIMNLAEDMVVSTGGARFALIYNGSTWRLA